MFESKTVGPFLVWKLKWVGGAMLPGPLVATPLHISFTFVFWSLGILYSFLEDRFQEL